MRRVSPGQVYEIADEPHGYYYGVIALGGDVVLLDAHAKSPSQGLEGVELSAELLRILVNHPTIRRPGWRLIGATPVEGRLAEYGRYVQGKSQSGLVNAYDNRDASITPTPESEATHLEVMAVWDAVTHVPKLLRQHFTGHPTHLSRDIRSPKFRRRH